MRDSKDNKYTIGLKFPPGATREDVEEDVMALRAKVNALFNALGYEGEAVSLPHYVKGCNGEGCDAICEEDETEARGWTSPSPGVDLCPTCATESGKLGGGESQ